MAAEQQEPAAYLDFYGRHGIIPVRQDLSDIERHFARRRALYRHLSLIPRLVQGARVLEIGPGTGDNALYTDSLGPTRYLLLDGNPASIAVLREKRDQGLFSPAVEIRQGKALDLAADETFDLVICEGLLPAQPDPAGFLRHIAGLAGKGGLVLVTTVSFTSVIAETCRRALLPLFTADSPDLPLLTRRLAEFFRPDLLSLPGMSRLHEDWVTDQIIHPYGPQFAFPLESAIRALAPDFQPVGTSPRIMQDWRWYKSVPESPLPESEFLAAECAAWNLGLIDCRAAPRRTPAELGREIEEMAGALWQRHLSLRQAPDATGWQAFLALAQGIAARLPPDFAAAADSLNSWCRGVTAWLAGTKGDFSGFHSFFGRGQQYLLLHRDR